jgi:hypothetical protein
MPLFQIVRIETACVTYELEADTPAEALEGFLNSERGVRQIDHDLLDNEEEHVLLNGQNVTQEARGILWRAFWKPQAT